MKKEAESIDEAPWYIRLLFITLCVSGLMIPLLFFGEIFSFLFGINKNEKDYR
jgi:hypothetical protein